MSSSCPKCKRPGAFIHRGMGLLECVNCGYMENEAADDMQRERDEARAALAERDWMLDTFIAEAQGRHYEDRFVPAGPAQIAFVKDKLAARWTARAEEGRE